MMLSMVILHLVILGMNVLAAEPSVAKDSAFTHIRPIPVLPEMADVYAADDVYTSAIGVSVHGSLFRYQEDSSSPVPDLVKDFFVDESSLSYTFLLHERRFHNEELVTAADVKRSIERYVRLKNFDLNWCKFLLGCEEYSAKRADEIKGVSVLGPDRIKLQVSSKYSSLIADLAGSFIPITHKDSAEIGIGSYRIDSRTSDEIRLVRMGNEGKKTKDDKNIDIVIVRKTDENSAIKGFLEGRFHDLFLYTVSSDWRKRIEKMGYIDEISTPRNHFAAINPRTVSNEQARRFLAEKIGNVDIRSRCYPESRATKSIAPYGFFGYEEPEKEPAMSALDSARLNKFWKEKKLKVVVDSTIGGTDCLIEGLMTLKSQFKSLEIESKPTADWVASWRKDDTDVVFSYLESEEPFFYFAPGLDNFTFGPVTDDSMESMIKGLISESSYEKKVDLASKLSKQIRSHWTYIPLFCPRVYLIYSRKYKPLGFKFIAPSLVTFSAFELK